VRSPIRLLPPPPPPPPPPLPSPLPHQSHLRRHRLPHPQRTANTTSSRRGRSSRRMSHV
jgi:hypothetical protein